MTTRTEDKDLASGQEQPTRQEQPAPQAGTPPEERLATDGERAVLHARARTLARPPDRNREGDGVLVVEFLLAGERYAVDASLVEEVAPVREIVPLPGAPAFTLGIINLRGEIRSLVDLRRLFGLPGSDVGERCYAVIIRNADMEFGLFAEDVAGVRTLRAGELQDGLPTLTGIRADYLKGVTAQGLAYLDAARLLSDRRITASDGPPRQPDISTGKVQP